MLAASDDSSRNGVPGSSSFSIRSRGRILPWLDRRSRSRFGRTWRACSCFARNCATNSRLRASLRRKSAPEVDIIDWILRMLSGLVRRLEPRQKFVLVEAFAGPLQHIEEPAVAWRGQRRLQFHALDGDDGLAARH